jgi:hypothetical protein
MDTLQSDWNYVHYMSSADLQHSPLSGGLLNAIISADSCVNQVFFGQEALRFRPDTWNSILKEHWNELPGGFYLGSRDSQLSD